MLIAIARKSTFGHSAALLKNTLIDWPQITRIAIQYEPVRNGRSNIGPNCKERYSLM